MTKGCKATHPKTGASCCRSDWPGHAELPHTDGRRAWTDDGQPAALAEDDPMRPERPAARRSSGLPIFDALMTEVFGR